MRNMNPQTYTPPTLSDDVFNVPYSGRTLTVEVPEQVVNAYNIVKRIMQYAGETFSMDDFIKNDK